VGAPAAVLDLIERFDRNADAYRSGFYNETQVRREFIDPFFKALGWDIDNTAGYAQAYKDVVHEDAIKVGAQTKAPDYCFRVGGTRKFFVEAKKPAVNVKDDIPAAFQLRRYAWSAKLPLSILTDFQEFAVYDCRVRPEKTDGPAVARTMYVSYTSYAEKWEEIASVFGKEAVLQGSFDRYAETTKGKKGTAEVDAAFLAEIEEWRSVLARTIALRNPRLSQRELNGAVQVTIDRIIFLRICEDRGIEDYGQLLALSNGANTYGRLLEVFRRADQRYNSGLFHFERERGRAEMPDTLTPRITIDDKTLKAIIKRLYYPDSPYEFSVLPADILGQVYEQFLGKVIRLTAGHRAVIEDKPEVKKAGGVYYTPTYIVDYIVKNTVGRLLEGSTPRKASGLRILDPACGSGSFLIGAYQYLLDWHRDWYVAHGPEKHRKELYMGEGEEYRLTTVERKRILLQSIYGVDIDAQAVEVTKLSLLLKVLEGESGQSLQAQLQLLQERALPDLEDNIKCGNALIKPDFYNTLTLDVLTDDERLRVNVFDWQAEFPEVLAGDQSGFDAVIGNPPYGALLSVGETEYLRTHYEATTRDLDTYVLFMERATGLAKPGGMISMIVPTGWYSGAKFSPLRRYVACQTDPAGFVNLPYDVFRAWVDTTVFVLKKRGQALDWPRLEPSPVRLRIFPKRHRISGSSELETGTVEADIMDWFEDGTDEYLTYADSATTALLRKVERSGRPLGELADVQRGVTPFKTTEEPVHSTSRRAFAGTIRRYSVDVGPKAYIRFDDSLAEPKPERYFCGPRLLLRELISRQFRLQAALVTEDLVTNKSMQSILARDEKTDLRFLLAVLNSRLMSWYFLQKSSVGQRDDFPKIVLRETRSLPMAVLDPAVPEERARFEMTVSLAGRIPELTRQLQDARVSSDRGSLERLIEAADVEIDRLVFQTYGLTAEEVAVVDRGMPTSASPARPRSR